MEKMGGGCRCYTVISKDEQADRSTGGKTQQKSKQTNNKTTKKKREEQKEKKLRRNLIFLGIKSQTINDLH